MRTMKMLLVSAVGLCALVACGPRPGPSAALLNMPDPNKDLHIHLTGGDDPSHLMGRFIPADLPSEEISATKAKQTQCTEFVKTKTIKSNVTRDELFEDSGELSLGLADAKGATFGAAVSSQSRVRVKYTITKVMEAVVEDPKAFNACCRKNPSQCEDVYIGRFVYGSGEIYRHVGNLAEFDGGADQAVKLGLEVKWGNAWEQATTFSDIYFGFELIPRAGDGETTTANAICDQSWWTALPQDYNGIYFMGMSPQAALETHALDLARDNVKTQAVEYLFGDYMMSKEGYDATITEGLTDSQVVMSAASEGLSRGIEWRCNAPAEIVDTPSGRMYVSKVLGYLPIDDRDKVAEEMIRSAIGALAPDAPERSQLEKLLGAFE